MQRVVESILPGQHLHPTQGTKEEAEEARSEVASCERERDMEAGSLGWVDFSLVLRLRGMTRQTSGPAEEAF